MLDNDLSLEFLRVVEEAAIACAHTVGQGDRHKSDQVAVETMRHVMDSVTKIVAISLRITDDLSATVSN